MNNIKFSLLYNLSCAEMYKESNTEVSNFYSKMAREIFTSKLPVIHRTVCEMIDEGLISKEGAFTFKGKLHTITNVFEYGPVHLGIELNKHLRAAIQRDILKTRTIGDKRVSGCLTYLSEKEINAILSDILDEVFDRIQNGADVNSLVSESVACFMESLVEDFNKANVILSGSNEVIVEEAVVEAEPAKKAKRKSKKTELV